MTTFLQASRGFTRRIDSKFIPVLATATVLILMCGIGALSFEGFASFYQFKVVVRSNAFLGVAAVGMTFVILSGGIDLSIGSVAAFTGVLVAYLVAPLHPEPGKDLPIGLGVDPRVAIALALLLGAAFGAAQGGLIHFFRQPPFLITLAGMFFARGMAYTLGEKSIEIVHPMISKTLQVLELPLGPGKTLGFAPLTFLACVLLGIFLAHFTRFGRAVYAIGDDEPSAALMGVPVGRTKIGVYALSGFLAALTGVVFALSKNAGWANDAIGFELSAIAAVVIGGTLLTGGVGYVAGTALGVLILGLIQVYVTDLNLNSWWTSMGVGMLLLSFIGLQMLVQSRAGRAIGSRSPRIHTNMNSSS